jgi:hypothetical protein
MKKFVFVSLLMSSMLASAETVKVGVIDYPPHINVKGREVTGHAVDYIKSVLKSVDLDANFVAYTSKRALSEFDKGNIDILLPIGAEVPNGTKLKSPFFHVTPGLCFRKENFISILSARHRFDGLKVGYADGAEVLSDLSESGAKMMPIKGKDILTRGIAMLKAERYDAIYHPSPINVYNQASADYDKVACSYFYGHSTAVYINTSAGLKSKHAALDDAFTKSIADKSYEFYFAENR